MKAKKHHNNRPRPILKPLAILSLAIGIPLYAIEISRHYSSYLTYEEKRSDFLDKAASNLIPVVWASTNNSEKQINSKTNHIDEPKPVITDNYYEAKGLESKYRPMVVQI